MLDGIVICGATLRYVALRFDRVQSCHHFYSVKKHFHMFLCCFLHFIYFLPVNHCGLISKLIFLIENNYE